MYQDIPETTRKQVVEMYQAGDRIKTITEATGLSRPNIYWVLRSEGQTPNRQTRGDTVTTSDLLAALQAAHQEIGKLEAEIGELRRKLTAR
jgi:hypothetical protein